MTAPERSFAERSFSSLNRGEGGDGSFRRPWMTWLLTGAILAVYVAQLAAARHGVDRLGTALACGPAAFARHRYWTLLTYAFAHAVPSRTLPVYAGFHLVTNVAPFFCLAPAVERRAGPWWLLAIFVVGAVGSALAWWAGRPAPGDAMIGASGALFAVIAAGGTLRLKVWRADLVYFQLPVRLDLRTAAVVLVALEVVQLGFDPLPGVAHVAHLGGALAGVFLAWFVPRAR